MTAALIAYGIPVVCELADRAMSAMNSCNQAELISRQQDLEAAQIKLNAHRAALDAELYSQELEIEAELRKREIAMHTERMRRTHALMDHVLQMAKHAFDQKMDLFSRTMSETLALARAELQSLSEETKEITKAVINPDTSDAIRDMLISRKHEITKERAALTKLISDTRIDAFERASLTHFNIPNRNLLSDH